jgi:hypothetical protein
MANDGNPAVNLEIVKGQEFDDSKSFKQAVMDWAIAMHFSTRTVKSDKCLGNHIQYSASQSTNRLLTSGSGPSYSALSNSIHSRLGVLEHEGARRSRGSQTKTHMGGSHRRVWGRMNTEAVASESTCLHLCHQVDVSSGDRGCNEAQVPGTPRLFSHQYGIAINQPD